MNALLIITGIKKILDAIPEDKKKAALEALKKLVEKELKKLIKG